MKRQSLLNQLQPEQVERMHSKIGREEQQAGITVANADTLQKRKIVKGRRTSQTSSNGSEAGASSSPSSSVAAPSADLTSPTAAAAPAAPSAEHIAKLTAFYEEHAPDKVQNVEATLAKYAGREEQLLAYLDTKYSTDQASAAPPAAPVPPRPMYEYDSPQRRASGFSFGTSDSAIANSPSGTFVFGQSSPAPAAAATAATPHKGTTADAEVVPDDNTANVAAAATNGDTVETANGYAAAAADSVGIVADSVPATAAADETVAASDSSAVDSGNTSSEAQPEQTTKQQHEKQEQPAPAAPAQHAGGQAGALKAIIARSTKEQQQQQNTEQSVEAAPSDPAAAANGSTNGGSSESSNGNHAPKDAAVAAAAVTNRKHSLQEALQQEAILDTKDAHTPDFRWIGLRKITYRDPLGRERQWEGCYRTTKKADAALDAVYITAETPEQQLIVVSQFRPAAGVHVLEFPAGLVDGDEAPDVAALRELKEETGYTGRVTSMTPKTLSDPGVLDCRQAFASVAVDSTHGKAPQPENEDSEFIAVHLLPLSGLRQSLEKLTRQLSDVPGSAGAEIDGALQAYAMGLERGEALAKARAESEASSVPLRIAASLQSHKDAVYRRRISDKRFKQGLASGVLLTCSAVACAVLLKLASSSRSSSIARR